MSKIGPVEGPSNPSIPSVAVQGPLPVHHMSTSNLLPGPFLVQSAPHVHSAKGSFPVCVSLSKDMAPKVSPARCASFFDQQQGLIYPASPVFSPALSRALTASLKLLTLLKFSQLVLSFYTEHPTQSAGYTALSGRYPLCSAPY